MTILYDPDVAAYLEIARNSKRPPFESLAVDAAREFYRSGRDTVNLPTVTIGEVEDLQIPGREAVIGLRRYLPSSSDEAGNDGCAILFLHGGGWVIGDLDTHDSICRHLVQKSGRQVIAVNYRLAPEHPFPAAVIDAQDAHDWVLENAGMLGLDPAKLIVAGDSAGGCLAIILSLTAEMRQRPRPMGQCLFYPVTDLRGETASYQTVQDVPITASTMHWFVGHYLQDDAQKQDWCTSPLLAPNLADLPPTFLTVAGHDPLCDEGLAFAQHCQDAGVSITLRHLPGQVHGYLTLGRLMNEADASLDAAVLFVNRLCLES